MTVLDANLKQAISDRCMHGPNVTLNANLVIQLIEYIGKLEKVAKEAADVAKLKNSLERCAQTAAITNTCRVVNPQGFSMYPAVDAMQEGASQTVQRVVVGQCDSLQSTLRTLDVDDLKDCRFELDERTNLVTMTDVNTGKKSQHLLTRHEVARIKNAIPNTYSMGARVNPAEFSAEAIRASCPDIEKLLREART